MIDTNRLRKLMDRQGLGVAELADKAGIDAGSLSRILRGADARSSSLYKLAHALGVSADYLLGLAEAAPGQDITPEFREVIASLDPTGRRAVATFARLWAAEGTEASFPAGDDVSVALDREEEAVAV